MKITISEFQNKYSKIILRFEKEWGMHTIWGGKITGNFKSWLRQKRNKRPTKCDICNKEFKSRKSMSNHRRHHNKEFREKIKKILKEAQNRSEVREKKSKALSGENSPNYGKFGKESANWRGGIAEYSALHKWLNIHMPKTGICNICGLPEFYNDLGPLEKSNKTGKLIRDINNFQWAHVPCHKKYDIENNIIHEGSSK